MQHPEHNGKPILIGDYVKVRELGGKEWAGVVMEMSWNRQRNEPWAFVVVPNTTKSLALPLTDVVEHFTTKPNTHLVN